MNNIPKSVAAEISNSGFYLGYLTRIKDGVTDISGVNERKSNGNYVPLCATPTEGVSLDREAILNRKDIKHLFMYSGNCTVFEQLRDKVINLFDSKEIVNSKVNDIYIVEGDPISACDAARIVSASFSLGQISSLVYGIENLHGANIRYGAIPRLETIIVHPNIKVRDDMKCLTEYSGAHPKFGEMKETLDHVIRDAVPPMMMSIETNKIFNDIDRRIVSAINEAKYSRAA